MKAPTTAHMTRSDARGVGSLTVAVGVGDAGLVSPNVSANTVSTARAPSSASLRAASASLRPSASPGASPGACRRLGLAFQQLVDLVPDIGIETRPLAQPAQQRAGIHLGLRVAHRAAQAADQRALLLGVERLVAIDLLREAAEIGHRRTGRLRQRIRQRQSGRHGIQGARQLERGCHIPFPVIDILDLRQPGRQRLQRYALGDQDRQDRFAELGGVAVFALARGRGQRLRRQRHHEDVAVANVREDLVPPLPAALQIVIDPDLVIQRFDVGRQILNGRFAFPCVADKDARHRCSPDVDSSRLPAGFRSAPCRPARR